jgi:hypothetical protein
MNPPADEYSSVVQHHARVEEGEIPIKKGGVTITTLLNADRGGGKCEYSRVGQWGTLSEIK